MSCKQPIALTSLLTCTRATSGWAENGDGTLQEFGPNELRITDKGLLVEEARTNSYPNSFDLTNNAVSGGSSQPTGDSFGPLQGCRILSGGASWNRAVGNTTTRTAGEKLSFTGYFKFGTSAKLIIMLSAPNGSGGTTYPSFNVDDTLSFDGNPGADWSDINVALIGNNLYKLTAVYTVQYDGSHVAGIGPNSNTSGEYVDVYGFQEELGAHPTSLIETTGATTTRAADRITFTDTSWLDVTQGTFLFETAELSNQYGRLVETGGIYPYVNTALNALVMGQPRGYPSGGLTWADTIKSAVGWDNSGRSLAMTGGSAASKAGTTFYANAASVQIGNRHALDYSLGGYIRSITYWPERKSDAELQELTT